MGKAKSALESQEKMLKRALKFLEKARKILKIREAYIVGSRARGDYMLDSDVDVVLVAEGVKNLNAKERVMLLSDAAEPNVEYLVYDVEEWNSEASVWIKELKRETVRIL